MSHRVALGLYRAHTIADPRVELFDRDNGSLVMGMAYSDPTVDETYGPVQTITLQMLWQGTNRSRYDAVQKAGRIQTLLMRGTQYLERKGGNLPSATDGSWHEGHAVTMTQFLSGMYQPVYWNVISGSVKLPDDYMDVSFSGGALRGTITLTAQAHARGTQQTLDNLVACGDFAQPFSVYDSAFTAGWSYSNVFNWSVSTEQAWWGDRSLKALGSSSDYFITNASRAVVPGDVLVPALMVYSTVALSGTVAIQLQFYNGTNWTSIAPVTITTLPTLPGTSTLQAATWTPVIGAATVLPAGAQQVRLQATLASVPSTTALYFDGVAIWRNPNNNRVPDEYVTGGYSLGIPHLRVYGVKGDTDTPLQLAVFPISNAYLGDTTYIGMMDLDTNVDKPLYPLDLRASAPMLRDSFGATAFSSVAESGHTYTAIQGTFGYAGGSLISSTDANGDALAATVGPQRYTASVYTAGTLNNATNYRVPQMTIGVPDATHAHQRIYLQNGTVHIDTFNNDGTSAGTTTFATTTADGTGYLLSIQRVYTASVYKLTVSVNGSALITSYSTPTTTGTLDGTKVGLRLAKGGSPATAASWDVFTVTPEAGTNIGPGEIAQGTDVTYPWGGYATQTVNTSTQSATYPLANNAGIGRTIDRYDRVYRAMAVYQSSTPTSASGTLTSGVVTVNNETANYLSIASGPLSATTNAGGFLLVDMGDFTFARPGTMWQELTEALDPTRTSFTLTNTGIISAGYGLYNGGIVLFPAEQFAAVKSPNRSYGFQLLNDGSKATAGNYDVNNFYNSGIRPEQYVPHDNMTLDGGELSLSPSLGQRSHCTLITIAPVYSVPNLTYFNDARTVYHAIVKYVPRYSLGVA
jgi:hypothetical protein